MSSLESVFSFAIANSEYYRTKAAAMGIKSAEQFSEFPILNREELRKHRDDIFCDEYRYAKTKQMRSVRTSGSTGQFVEAFWTDRDYFASTLCLWRKRMEWYDISPRSRKCTFFTGERIGATKIDSTKRVIKRGNEISFSCIHLSADDVENYYSELKCFMPEWIYVTPSVLLHLLYHFEKTGKQKLECVKYVELFGENVSVGVCEKAKEYFPNASIGIMYGTQELNGIALSCKYGRLHILEDNVFLECDKNSDAIITSLKNRNFPIIRYRVGDKLSVGYGKCKCGCEGKYVEKIDGRSADSLIIDPSIGLSKHAIKDAIHVVDAVFDYPILQYKVSVESPITVYLFCDEKYKNWEDSIKETLDEKLKQLGLKDFRITFNNTPLCVSAASGKV